jgi:hypothetical protein
VNRALGLLAVLALCGCGDDLDAPGDAPDCARPDVDAATLEPLLARWITELPAPRATQTEREAARSYLAAELERLGWEPELHAYASGANLLATLPASAPSAPSVIVGAHFDTVPDSPGANDNASGVAVVLAVARALADASCREVAITVAFFDEEERGLFGARALAQARSPADVLAVHTIDQVAWDEDGDRVFELEQPTPALEQAWRAAAEAIGVPVVTTATTGTDHQAFRERGFAAIGLTEEYVGGDTSPHRHLATDTPDTVDLDYLVLAARLAIRVVSDQVQGPAASRARRAAWPE